MISPTSSFLPSNPPGSPDLASHFVQALHDFFPANAPTDNASGCLFFQRGAIIEVYNRDASGWWDGVTEGLRGWFPSNYVGRLGELRRHSADYDDLQDTPQLQEFIAWRHGLTAAILASGEGAIELIDTEDSAVLPTTHCYPNVIDSMSHPSYSEDSNHFLHHSLHHYHNSYSNCNNESEGDNDNDNDNGNQGTPNRVELAKALLDDDRQKSEMASSSSSPSPSPSNHHTNDGTINNNNKKLHAHNLDYLLEDANNRISDLVEDCGQRYLFSNIQLVIFQVVSSIRSVLTTANTVSKDSPLLKSYPELARQRKSVLSSLSKLVLKGKELQTLSQLDEDYAPRRKVQDEIPVLANQLLMDMGLFENVLRSIVPSPLAPSDDDDDDDDDDDESDNSIQEDDHDRYSMPSSLTQTLGDKNLTQGTFDSMNTTISLRQQLVAARLSSASLIAKVVPLSDAQHIIQTIMDHQDYIDELIGALLITVEEFLTSRQRATHMLEMARKTVEAVRTFLAVVEHVCSNVGDMDYKHCSIIPEDPHLVALVLAKEAVYSAITNLVTAVRALTGPKGEQTEDYDDLYHLQSSCENVTRTTNECASCVRVCLYVDDPSIGLSVALPTTASLGEMRDRLESSVDTRRNQTLSILGRKVTSLNVLQQRYDNEGDDSDNSPITIAVYDNKISEAFVGGASTEDLTADTTLTASTETKFQHTVVEQQPKESPAQLDQQKQYLDATSEVSRTDNHDMEAYNRQLKVSASEPSTSSSAPATSAPAPESSADNDSSERYQRQRTRSIPSVGNRSIRSNHNKAYKSHPPPSTSAAAAVSVQRRSQATTRSSCTTSVSSVHTTNGAIRPLSGRSSAESFNMTPLTTPEAMSPVNEYNDVTSLAPQLAAKGDTLQRQGRRRSSSINTLALTPPSSHQSLSSTQRMPLPPIPPSPMEPPPDLKLVSSKSTPAFDQSATSTPRRPRGMSVTALRMSMKQKHDDQRSTNSTLIKEPANSKTVNRISSRSSIQSTDQNSTNDKHDQEAWFLKQRSFSADEVILNAGGHLTGATIEALVEKLTSHEKSPDLVFTRAFFYNFRLFTTPSVFVDLLIQRFRLSPPSDPLLSEEELTLWKNRVLVPVRLRVYNVIKTWLETYYRYEQDDVESQLMVFATQDMQEAMPGPAKRMVNLIQRTFEIRGHSISHRKMSYAICSTTSSHSSTLFGVNSSNISLSEYNPLRPPLQSKNSSSHLSLSSGSSLFSDLSLFGSDSHHSSYISSSSSFSDQLHYPPINLTRSLRNSLRKALSQKNLTQVHISDFDCMELARQFTLMESTLFCQITPYEMIGQEFKKNAGESTAIHVKAMIQKSTQVSRWISDSILREQDAKRRSQMIKFWIKVGECCLHLNNYNTLMEIRSALDSTSIRRLKKSWDYLSAKYTAMMEPIYRATDTSRNFAEYRARLKTAVAPCLPFLGVYLTDMTFIDDGNSNTRTTPSGHTLINFDKYVKTTKVLNEIDQFQIPYKLLEVEDIQRYLLLCLDAVEMDEQVYYNRSISLEPRQEPRQETRQEDPSINDVRHTISQFT